MSTKRELLEARLARAQKALAAHEATESRFGAEPPVGTVIQFAKRFSDAGRDYVYVALRTEAGWFLTGQTVGAKTWAELVEFIGVDAPFATASEWALDCVPTADQIGAGKFVVARLTPNLRRGSEDATALEWAVAGIPGVRTVQAGGGGFRRPEDLGPFGVSMMPDGDCRVYDKRIVRALAFERNVRRGSEQITDEAVVAYFAGEDAMERALQSARDRNHTVAKAAKMNLAFAARVPW
jgi:hypothetical protein